MFHPPAPHPIDAAAMPAGLGDGDISSTRWTSPPFSCPGLVTPFDSSVQHPYESTRTRIKLDLYVRAVAQDGMPVEHVLDFSRVWAAVKNKTPCQK